MSFRILSTYDGGVEVYPEPYRDNGPPKPNQYPSLEAAKLGITEDVLPHHDNPDNATFEIVETVARFRVKIETRLEPVEETPDECVSPAAE